MIFEQYEALLMEISELKADRDAWRDIAQQRLLAGPAELVWPAGDPVPGDRETLVVVVRNGTQPAKIVHPPGGFDVT